MSAIGASGQSQYTNLYQYLQSLNNSATTGTAAPQNAGSTTGPGDSGSIQQIAGTTTGSTTSPSGTSLVQQLESSIQNALNGVSSTQSNNPQDVLSAIEQAIQSTLQGSSQGANQTQQAGHHHHHHHGGGGNGGKSPGTAGNAVSALTTSAGSGSAAEGASAATGGNNSATSQTPGLNALLSQLGVDPQQFRNDVSAGVSNSQSGTPNFAQVFQSFPSGQAVNALV